VKVHALFSGQYDEPVSVRRQRRVLFVYGSVNYLANHSAVVRLEGNAAAAAEKFIVAASERIAPALRAGLREVRADAYTNAMWLAEPAGLALRSNMELHAGGAFTPALPVRGRPHCKDGCPGKAGQPGLCTCRSPDMQRAQPLIERVDFEPDAFHKVHDGTRAPVPGSPWAEAGHRLLDELELQPRRAAGPWRRRGTGRRNYELVERHLAYLDPARRTTASWLTAHRDNSPLDKMLPDATMVVTTFAKRLPSGGWSTELTDSEVLAANDLSLPGLRLKRAPLDDGIDGVTIWPKHRSVYVLAGAANAEWLHEVVSAQQEAPQGECTFVRVASIMWGYSGDRSAGTLCYHCAHPRSACRCQVAR